MRYGVTLCAAAGEQFAGSARIGFDWKAQLSDGFASVTDPAITDGRGAW